MFSIPSTGALSLSGVTADSAQPAGQAKSPMADSFGALMAELRQTPAHGVTGHGGHGPSMVSNLVQAGNSTVQSVMDKVHHLHETAGSMSFGELAATGAQLTMDTALVMFQLNAGMGMVQSSKSAVQTLFKNQ